MIHRLLHLLSLTIFFSLVTEGESREKRIFTISIFYDETYSNIPDITSYSSEIIDRFTKKSSFRFEYTINRVAINYSYKITKILCNELKEGRIAILAIGTSPVFDQLRSIANSLKIPYLAIKWDDENALKNAENSDISKLNKPLPNQINLHPPANKLIHAIINLIEMYKWEYITVIYQETTGPERIQEFIKLPTTSHIANKKFRLNIRQLSSDIESWIYLIKDIKLSGSSHIIVDIETKYLNKFCQIAEEVGLMTSYFHLIFTTLDLSIIDLSPSANVTALQLNDPDNTKIMNVKAEFNLKNMVVNKPLIGYLSSEAALIYDAFLVLANTIDRHNLVDILPNSPRVSCEKETRWSFGDDFMNYIKMSNVQGLSGNIEFDQQTGFRKNLSLHIVDLSKRGVSLVAKWIEKDPISDSFIKVVRSYEKEKKEIDAKLNRHLIVTTKLEAPYVMIKSRNNNETYHGNDQYHGFCISMLERIAEICKFNFTIKLVEDGFHGAIVNGKWNGIVSELIDKKADLAVAALTINFQREQVIDFTKPFLNLGISILYKRPQKKTPNLFSFLSPLSIEIWLYMIAAYLVVSFMLFVIARFSPYEWQNPHPCNQNSDITHNQFTIMNSLWFTIGSLMQQGTNLNPRAPSVRVISCAWGAFTLILISSYTANLAAFLTVQRMQTPISNAEDLSRQTEIKYGAVLGNTPTISAGSLRILTVVWWFFALIMISSYTANLAAFQTVKRFHSPIESVEDLANQGTIKYGCHIFGSTISYFRESKIQTYEKMWNFMNSNPDNFVKSTDEGIERIRKGNYAYLVESTTNEYMKQRDCDLMQIGGLLDTKGYGIATPTGSPWRDKVSNAVLQMHENGDIQEFYIYWWKKYGIPEKSCDSSDEKRVMANELKLENVGGVFVVLSVGLSVALVVAILEFTWKAKQTSHEQLPFSQRFKNGFGNIASNFCKGTFVNTFPKISLTRILHHQQHAPHLHNMVAEIHSRTQASRIENNMIPVDAFEGLKSSDQERNRILKKRSMKSNNKSVILGYPPVLRVGSTQRLDYQSLRGTPANRSYSSEARNRLSMY